jgi:hypothetical protein
MNHFLINPLLGGRPPSYSSYDDPVVLRVCLAVLAALAVLIGWAVYERSQWKTIATSNTWLRVAKAGDERRFTPVLVDDVTGRVYQEQIGPKRCIGGPAAMPLGSSVLVSIRTRRDVRDGRMTYVLDSNELGLRVC